MFTTIEQVQDAMIEMLDREAAANARGDTRAASEYAAEWKRLARTVLPTFW